MYSTKDLAIIIPTKDRPVLVKRHLQSLLEQECKLGQVIVVASGQDIKNIVLGFKNRLPVEYYRSESGQIKQRNLGISKLNERTKLVATMDDDVTYHENAISEMIRFWNGVESNTAGVGFNIVNRSEQNNFNIINLILRKLRRSGRVLKSGLGISFTDLKYDIKVQWLNGGTTVWDYEILKRYHNNVIDLKWAVSEDIIFSYPIGKKYDLMACANSMVNVEDEITSEKSKAYYINRGKLIYSMSLYFVAINNDLKYKYFFLNQFSLIIKLLLKSIVYLEIKHFYLCIGTIKGMRGYLDLFNNPKTLLNRIIKEDYF